MIGFADPLYAALRCQHQLALLLSPASTSATAIARAAAYVAGPLNCQTLFDTAVKALRWLLSSGDFTVKVRRWLLEQWQSYSTDNGRTAEGPSTEASRT